MLKVTHNLTIAELCDRSVNERQQAVNEQILKSHALLRHHRASDGLPPVLGGRWGVSTTGQQFREALHSAYQRNGLVLHEFIEEHLTA